MQSNCVCSVSSQQRLLVHTGSFTRKPRDLLCQPPCACRQSSCTLLTPAGWLLGQQLLHSHFLSHAALLFWDTQFYWGENAVQCRAHPWDGTLGVCVSILSLPPSLSCIYLFFCCALWFNIVLPPRFSSSPHCELMAGSAWWAHSLTTANSRARRGSTQSCWPV